MEGVRTVLSIDGGGVRGLIPGAVLECLETQLQVYKQYDFGWLIVLFSQEKITHVIF